MPLPKKKLVTVRRDSPYAKLREMLTGPPEADRCFIAVFCRNHRVTKETVLSRLKPCGYPPSAAEKKVYDQTKDRRTGLPKGQANG
jgi:hypothetical protein